MKMRQHSCGRLKGILFEHRSISRKDIIELSKLNGRTVTRCMESFAEQGLVEISHQIIGRGQPQIVYTLRQENIFFLILSVIPGELYAILCDNRGFPISMDRYALENPGQKKELSQLLFSAVSKIVAEPVLQGKSIYAAAVNFSFDQALPLNYRNHIRNVLSGFCSHEVFCAYSNEFLLSQFAINNHLSGKVFGMNHKDIAGWQHVAVNNYCIDQTAAGKVDKLLNRRTPYAAGKTWHEVLAFRGFLKHFYEEYSSMLANTFSHHYSEVYSRALYGDQTAVGILEEYALMLFRGMEYINSELDFDHFVLMHSRPIIIDKIKKLAAASPCKFSFCTANFSPCEFIYSPAGYLRRNLFNFEHGKLLKDLHN